MSTVNVNRVVDASGGVLAPISSVMRNRLINSAMVIDQRNAGASVTPTNQQFLVDRWQYEATQTSKFTAQQNAGAVTPPVGFTNYLGFTSTSAFSVASGDIFAFRQRIEGFNVADLGWGTANAKTVTLSFWVRSSLTGTFGGTIKNDNARSYPFTFTISSANTWEQKSVTIAGDTSGTWATNNAVGVAVTFGLGVGSTYSGTAGSWSTNNFYASTGATSIVGTNGATFYITGVQLEVGTQATSFEYRQYTNELQLCQRYAINYRSADAGVYMRYGSGYANATTNSEINVHFPVQMRTTPSLTTTATASNYAIYTAGGINVCSTLPVIDANSDNPLVLTVLGSSATPFTSGAGCSIISNNNTASYMLFTAEL